MEGSILEAFLRESFKGSNFIMRPPYDIYPVMASDDGEHRSDDGHKDGDTDDNLIKFIAEDLTGFPKEKLNEGGMYFIDGAENKYLMGYVECKVEDGEKAYPVYVGDISVCCCELHNERFTSYFDNQKLIISLPSVLIDKPKNEEPLDLPGIGRIQVCSLPYPHNDKDVDVHAAAKQSIHEYMRACEACVLELLCKYNSDYKAKVFIDGHFPWNDNKALKSFHGHFIKLKEEPGIESVISIDKSFSFQDRPLETRKYLLALQNTDEDIHWAPLEDNEKPYEVIWYLKLRDDPTVEGVTSDIIECACVFKGDENNKKDVIKTWNKDLLSLACPTCYGIEDRNRWRTHIYPIFLTELRCKSIKLSPTTIKQLMYGTTKQ